MCFSKRKIVKVAKRIQNQDERSGKQTHRSVLNFALSWIYQILNIIDFILKNPMFEVVEPGDHSDPENECFQCEKLSPGARKAAVMARYQTPGLAAPGGRMENSTMCL